VGRCDIGILVKGLLMVSILIYLPSKVRVLKICMLVMSILIISSIQLSMLMARGLRMSILVASSRITSRHTIIGVLTMSPPTSQGRNIASTPVAAGMLAIRHIK
jgi:hypothetical protein